MKSIVTRAISERDNSKIAQIIRATLTEFGANKKGTVFYDSATDSLFELFRAVNAYYFVAELNGKLVGGAGIYPTSGLPSGTCELVKMYLLPEARGIGLGKSLIEQCIEMAKEFGFNTIYLESMPELKQALKVYEKSGFVYLDKPLGSSGHFGCDLWMSKKI